ncbi:MAG TPA: family 78 glycoside hydrolase catalytic domain [Bryobacteraceae bacterium]|nr:family 78 glycoside hydrolase catalytic domain [Bryobacteraceae bacterium]
MRLSFSHLFAISFFSASLSFAGPLAPTQLRCEYLKNPEAVDVAAPRFSWLLNHTDRAQKQTAYQVQVSKKADFAGPLTWDSEKTVSASSVQVEYKGVPLTSDADYYWRVRYWDAQGNEGPWSARAQFSTGLFQPSDWRAKWIAGGTAFRRGFDIEKQVKRARVFVAAAGYYELSLNGKKVGDHVLDPAWTDYNKRILYSTYDVTNDLHRGRNAAAALLGRGWYGKAYNPTPKFICQIQGEYTDGKHFEIVTDATWQVLKSPIVMNDVYDGETYDARLEVADWDSTAFNEHDASTVPATVADIPNVILSSQMMPAIKVVDTMVPHKMYESSPGVYVFDFEQNFSGWVKLKVQGAAGTKVRIRYAEIADPDGRIRVDNLRAARATDTYILRGDSNGEEYEPRFTYHGFRYAEVSGYPGVPTLTAIRGSEVHTAVESTGNLVTSSALLNQIQSMFLWSIKTNLASVPTDCDQRDERLGWMGDAHLSAETAIMNFDMAAFYTNFLRDIRDAQGSEGEVPNIVPYIKQFNPSRVGDPSWGLAYPLIAEYMFENYGDRRVLAENYAGLKAWADFLTKHAPDGVMDYSYFGDWVAIDPTPKLLCATWAYIKALEVIVMAANVLDRPEDAKHYGDLIAAARQGFNKRFRNADGTYATGSQAAQVLALDAHVMPGRDEGDTLSRLLDDVNYYHNVHLTTGILGTKYLFPTLASRGESDLAYEVLTQTDYPSFGFMLEHGATTLWELWQERTGPEMNSHNHHMFASPGTFLYNILAGINRVGNGGETDIRIQPQLVHGLEWVSASTNNIHGKITSSWHRSGSGYMLNVTVPVGSKATVYLPKLKLESPAVLESGHVVNATTSVPGVEFVSDRRSYVVRIGSGEYQFRVTESDEVPARPGQ